MTSRLYHFLTCFIDNPELRVDGDLDCATVVRGDLCVQEKRPILVIPELDDRLEIGNARWQGEICALGEEIQTKCQDESQRNVSLEFFSRLSFVNVFFSFSFWTCFNNFILTN